MASVKLHHALEYGYGHQSHSTKKERFLVPLPGAYKSGGHNSSWKTETITVSPHLTFHYYVDTVFIPRLHTRSC
jgi:hypothetical protein